MDTHENGAFAQPGFDVVGQDLSDRHALRRVAGLSTELEDVTEVEYRQVRLERVVLAGVWTSGTVRDADRSLAELALLAETAGSLVLDGVIQRRDTPDPATYLGSGKAKELRDIVAATGADTVICDGELSPSERYGCDIGENMSESGSSSDLSRHQQAESAAAPARFKVSLKRSA